MAFIKLQNVGVTYRVAGVKGAKPSSRTIGSAGGAISFGAKSAHVRALDSININIADGERIGLLGHNGAGKSTLLRVLSGLLPPTQGSLTIDGRIVPLLSMSLGLDNYSSGRQNVFLRAQLMGIEKDVIEQRLKMIEEFSDLGDYLDLPLKTYSSGMRMRLAFAIATSFEPEILVLDEWLSAGDDAFKKKASERMNTLVDSARILVIASHSRNLIKRVCSKAMVLRAGKQIYFGPVDEALEVLDDPLFQPGETPKEKSQRRSEIHKKRVAELLEIKTFLETFNEQTGQYPNTYSEWLGKSLDKDFSGWIPELVPRITNAIPQDPMYTPFKQDCRYLYKSDGTGYKLIAFKPGDLDLLTVTESIKPDPVRQTWAYGLWTEGFKEL